MIGVGAAIMAAAMHPSIAAPPVTTNFTFAQVGDGWTFAYNDTSDATKRFLPARSTTGHPTVTSIWCGWITGTDATVIISGSSPATGLVEVSVDGADWTIPTYSGAGGVFPLFSGLSDARHLVCIRIGNTFGNTRYMAKSGTVMTAKGVAPAITPFGNWRQPYDGSTDTAGAQSSATQSTTNFYPPTYPTFGMTGGPVATSTGANAPAIKVKGDYTTLAVASLCPYVFVSVDNAAPTIYYRGSGTFGIYGVTVIEGLSGTHTYTIWGGNVGGGGDKLWLSVGGLFASIGVQDCGFKGRLYQVGDSITYGANATSYGHTDTFLAALSLNRVGGNFGLSGNKIADVKARIDGILAGLKNVTTDDAMVIAIGVNDGVAVSWDSTMQANYKYIIDACLTKGFGRVLCRAILPESDGTRAPIPNASLSSLIASNYSGDARVQFVDTASWPAVSSVGGGLLHPDDTGYRTLAPYAAAAYAAAGA